MFYPEKAKIGIPKKVTKHHFYNFQETTSTWFLPNIPFIKRIKGGSKINFDYDLFTRCFPMPLPTMGTARINVKWWFIPCRQLFKSWNEFRSQSVVHAGSAKFINKCPNLKLVDLIEVLVADGACTKAVGVNDPFDINHNGTHYKLLNKGIQIFTILYELGYDLITKKKDDTSWNGIYGNAMPLLAFAKLILDRYIPREWADYEYTYNSIYALYNSVDTFSLTQAQIGLIYELMFKIPYNTDYYTSIWKNPSGPNNVTYMTAVTGQAGDIENDDISAGSNIAHLTLTDSGTVITQQDLNTLAAMDKFLKKNQIVGTKYWDRLLAHFGVKTDKALINIPELIDDKDVDFKFSEIYSQAQTLSGETGANLGSYGGMGFANIDNILHFNYEADEEGYLICCACAIPDVGYCQGFDNETLIYEPLEFWNEEYDGCGTNGVRGMELDAGRGFVTPMVGNTFYGANIGFRPQYAAEKTMRNKVSGLFGVLSQRAEFEKWTFARYHEEDVSRVINLEFSIGAQYGSDDTENGPYSQFGRMFYAPAQHNFAMYFRFNWDMWNNMRPLYEYCNIADDDDKVITKSINESV